MQVVDSSLVAGKKILLRYDIDVQITDGRVTEDFKLRTGLETLKLCLENAAKVVMIGHLGRPDGQVVSELSVEPVRGWFREQGFSVEILENLRFDSREEACDLEYAKELAEMGDVYINEAFSSHNKAASTTIVPTLLPHFTGLHFTREVKVLTSVRDNPKKPYIGIMGGAKVKDKLPVITVMAQRADCVLVGGKLVAEIREQGISLPKNVLVGKLNEDGFDISEDTTASWADLITKAALIVWNGPLGKFEDSKYDQTKKVTEMVLDCGAEVVIGGGDSVASLNQYGLLEKAQQKGFVSVGGGAMLKFLANGTLPTIEALG